MLPDGFDLNDVRFYLGLFTMIGLALMTWHLRRVSRRQEADERRLALAEGAILTGVVGEARPIERVRTR